MSQTSLSKEILAAEEANAYLTVSAAKPSSDVKLVNSTMDELEANYPTEEEFRSILASESKSEEAKKAILEDGELLDVNMTQKVVMLIATTMPALGVVVAIATAWQYGWMGWSYLAMVIGGWLLTGLGITVGFHRLLSHRSFETYRLVRAFWMVMGSLSIEGSPLTWAAVHRRHHARSDKHGDPHSPHLHGTGIWEAIKGFCHAQVGWLFTGYWSRKALTRYVPDLMQDKMLVAIDRFYVFFVLASLAIPAALGGLIEGTWWGVWMGFLWGGLVRVFVTHHVTWSINSICHIFGKMDYQAGDQSRNNLVCGVLALGEGWHNNHHAFPTSARHGLKWWQLDISWIVITGMRLTGLVWNIKLPSERLLRQKKLG